MANIAVLIPAHNEAKVIRKSVLSCYAAGMKPEDVYVVDDGSTDNTTEVAKHYKAQVLTKPNGGKADALKSGCRHFNLRTRYSHVAVLDADSSVSKEYFTEMLKEIEHPRSADVAVFCGTPRSIPHNWLTAYRAVEYAIGLGVYREAQSFMGAIYVAPGCASVYRTDVFDDLEFGGTLVEDMDLTMQVQRAHKRIVYVPDAIVFTQDPATIRGFAGQLSRWYRGTWQVVRKHKLMRHRQVIDFEVGYMMLEAVFFSVTMLAAPFLFMKYPVWVSLCLLLDQALLLTYAGLVAIRERRLDVLWAFPLFVIPRAVNFAVFLWAFFAERRTRETKWFAVARY